MRFLIDGYNLMHSKGLVPSRRPASGLHHARTRFLDALHQHLGPIRAALVTVVFDASDAPPQRPSVLQYKSMKILFAVGDENADARIEALLAAEPNPRAVTVVSSDRRVLEFARRRRASILTSDAFWSRSFVGDAPARPAAPEPRVQAMDESGERWEDVFAGVDDVIERETGVAGDTRFAPTEAEVDRIAREVAAEVERDASNRPIG